MTILFIVSMILLHVIIDANLISRRIRIIHWLESSIFAGLCFVYCLITGEHYSWMALLAISLRMALYDILLNWCRFLPFDYVGTNSWKDRIEKKLGVPIKLFRFIYFLIAFIIVVCYLQSK